MWLINLISTLKPEPHQSQYTVFDTFLCAYTGTSFLIYLFDKQSVTVVLAWSVHTESDHALPACGGHEALSVHSAPSVRATHAHPRR